jgi:hypothetical protein
MDYQDAQLLLEGKAAHVEKYPFAKKQDPDRVKLKHVTYLKRDPDDRDLLIVELFEKDIMFYRPNGTIMLDSCGWRTVTTKQRFNEYLPHPWSVYQDRSVWYVGWGYWNGKEERRVWVYEDGCMIDGDSIEGVGEDPDKLKKLNRQVGTYVNGFVAALFEGDVPAPGPGDCWMCLMVTGDGESLGDITGSDHILSHIEEKYYVPSLLMRAIDQFPIGQIVVAMLQEIWSGGDVDSWSSMHDVAKRQFKSSLRRYIRRQVGLAS